jgi:hypothetical protein
MKKSELLTAIFDLSKKTNGVSTRFYFFRIHTICNTITNKKGVNDPEVYVESYVALNGRLPKNTSIQKFSQRA